MTSDSNDDRLCHDFMRLGQTDADSVLEVAIVEWHGPHTPHVRWQVTQRFAAAPSADELVEAQRRVLNDARFFRMCDTCSKRKNVGHLHSRNMCQSCAERTLGIVH
jgi:hypothetical protein